MLTRYSMDMDGSMEPDEAGWWVRYEDAAKLQETPAPEELKDHKCAELVNRLRTIAIAFHDHDQLREIIAAEIRPLFRAAQQSSALTDEQVDRILSTQIPGGSSARDWFLPFRDEKGLNNIRCTARRMLDAYEQRKSK